MAIRLRWTALLVVGLSTSAALAGGGHDRTEQAQPISPESVVIGLFNGKDMTGLHTWLEDTGRKNPLGVFKVENGMLHVSGKTYGYVATDKEYRDYRLVVEYKPA